MTSENENNQRREIKETIEAVLGRMNIAAEVEEQDLMGMLCFHIRTPDGWVFLGEGGQYLGAFQYLIKRIIEKRVAANSDVSLLGSRIQFFIDVNDFHRKRLEEVKERARLGAQRVRYFKKEVIMQPMPAYERRVVHMTLAEDPDIITESRGEGEERAVVIKPASV